MFGANGAELVPSFPDPIVEVDGTLLLDGRLPLADVVVAGSETPQPGSGMDRDNVSMGF